MKVQAPGYYRMMLGDEHQTVLERELVDRVRQPAVDGLDLHERALRQRCELLAPDIDQRKDPTVHASFISRSEDGTLRT